MNQRDEFREMMGDDIFFVIEKMNEEKTRISKSDSQKLDKQVKAILGKDHEAFTSEEDRGVALSKIR